MHQQDSQPRISSSNLGWDSQQMQSDATSQTWTKHTRDTDDALPANYGQPSRPRQQPTQKSKTNTRI